MFLAKFVEVSCEVGWVVKKVIKLFIQPAPVASLDQEALSEIAQEMAKSLSIHYMPSWAQFCLALL